MRIHLGGQGTKNDRVFLSFFEHPLVINSGPLRITDRLAGPLDEALPQESRSVPSPMRPWSVAAFFPHRRKAGPHESNRAPSRATHRRRMVQSSLPGAAPPFRSAGPRPSPSPTHDRSAGSLLRFRRSNTITYPVSPFLMPRPHPCRSQVLPNCAGFARCCRPKSSPSLTPRHFPSPPEI